MKFLEREREAVARLAEPQPRQRKLFEGTKLGDRGKGATHFGTGQKNSIIFVLSTEEIHTSDCTECQKLPTSVEGGRFKLLKRLNACCVWKSPTTEVPQQETVLLVWQ